jgi:hypothetical protein
VFLNSVCLSVKEPFNDSLLGEPNNVFSSFPGQSRSGSSLDDDAQLHYNVLSHPRDEQDTYRVRLTLPQRFITPGEPLQLRMLGSASQSRRFFGIYEE